MPKQYLVSTTRVFLQAELLKMVEELPDATALVLEVINFRVKNDPLSAHGSCGSLGEGQHDNVVLTTAVSWLVRGAIDGVWRQVTRTPAEGLSPSARIPG